MTKLFEIDGAVTEPGSLTDADLAALPGQVPDVSRVVPGKRGQGVLLAGVLEFAGADPEAAALELESSDGSFRATLPLAAVRHAVLAYRLAGGPLPEKDGGPVRFLTPHDGGCDKTDGHACANVKGLGRIRVVAG